MNTWMQLKLPCLPAATLLHHDSDEALTLSNPNAQLTFSKFLVMVFFHSNRNSNCHCIFMLRCCGHLLPRQLLQP